MSPPACKGSQGCRRRAERRETKNPLSYLKNVCELIEKVCELIKTLIEKKL